MEEESGRRHQGGGIIREASWRRHHGGCIMEEASGRRHQGEGLSRRHQGGCIKENAFNPKITKKLPGWDPKNQRKIDKIPAWTSQVPSLVRTRCGVLESHRTTVVLSFPFEYVCVSAGLPLGGATRLRGSALRPKSSASALNPELM